jgi:hypothetical protein
MVNTSGLHYAGSIPSQLSGSVVQYYLYAADRSSHNAIMPFMGPSDPFTFTADYPVIIGNTGNTNSLLLSNSPNPFSSSTIIRYKLPERGFVRLEVMNALGNVSDILVNTIQEKGEYSLTFNAGNIPDGVYYLRMIYGKSTITKKLLRIR